MRAISLKIPERTLAEAARLARSLELSRAAYLREAIERHNSECARALARRRMAAASRKVRDTSMRINAEFDAFESSADPSDSAPEQPDPTPKDRK